MKQRLSKRAAEMTQGGIRAFFDKAAQYPDAIHLGIGEPDFPTPPEIIEAAERALRDGYTHYTPNAGLPEAREAAADYLNMAQETADGMKITVPSKEEAKAEGLWVQVPESPEGAAGQQKINLNTAGKEELMTLRGIGEAKAEAILRYREEQGPFESIEEIMNISGIKEAAFQKIKDDITV